MPRTLCAALPAALRKPGPVTIEGWIHRRRQLASVSFVVLRDRSGLAQAVVTDPAVRQQVSELPEETVVRLTGTASRNAKAPGGVELVDPAVHALSAPAAASPLELWRPELGVTLPVALDHAALSWRHPTRRAVWQIAAASLTGFRRHLDGAGFTEVSTPKIVGQCAESGANVFALDYFGAPAYLAQSPQLYKQMLTGVFERVYEVGPVFRAEPHDTARHLAEYVSLDVEFGFVRDHRDVLAQLRATLAAMLEAIAEKASAAVETAGVRLPVVPEEIPVVHFREALELVGAAADEPDLAPEHERFLGAWAKQRYDSDFLAVEGYPAAKRPFYTHPQPDDPRWTNSFDLLFRGLELVTGGQRLHNHADYLAALAARRADPAAYDAYLAAMRHGMPPHGGFAIGLERWVSRLTEADNIRRAALFPRDRHRLQP
ncbi:aspartate--tRNA ligase [Nocardia brasiliensis NBRC 14402]|uniref:aspartate--tRNA(Asn) ligase n=1 Tax=Nocardia brasiliensis TaxID=37326 RepID=UPI00030128A2|nr:aspartate--tRNA(Asn) ligase [Nocardia brasiliensis]ASF12911.1 aspartate--tRNA(Asn) ligase [Nocardia brasiliensis]GAJ80865.1 aspartate--tRNA ligase [Nocardia brasiliensis NBRC 14402]SUB54360.1 Asparagine--tRNA ligase [Nocardia brasiliensis]